MLDAVQQLHVELYWFTSTAKTETIRVTYRQGESAIMHQEPTKHIVIVSVALIKGVKMKRLYKKKVYASINPLNPELNPICYLLALLGAHHFLHVSRTRVKSLTFRRLMSYIYGAPILDVSRSHTTTQHSR